jgi:NADPH:quinone reductase-like Zn-dependent oxidoreductase
LDSLRPGGRLVSIAQPPDEREHIDTGYIFVRPSGYDLGEQITPLVHEDALRPRIEETFPLERAADAHERLEAGHVHGKLVLTID